MTQVEVLRAIVAKLGETKPEAIGASFSLATPELKGSIKRAALAASIRRELGINCPAAHSVTTFAELEQAVFSPAAPAVAVATQAASPRPIAATATPAPVVFAGTAKLRCGVDVEMVSELPEATDYREHEFYRDAFAQEEIAYCIAQENPRMHFAARWCVKEALHKCDPAFRDKKMADIELVRSAQGELSLRQRENGSTHTLPHAVSLSHTNSLAMAVVVTASDSAASANSASPAPSESGPSASNAATASSGSSLPLISALAWLLAMGVSILALVRTFH